MYAVNAIQAGNNPSNIGKFYNFNGNDLDLTADGLKVFLHNKLDSDNNEDVSKSYSSMRYAISWLKQLDLYPVGPNRNFASYDGYNTEKFKEIGVYRQGLDYVPYDNFPALLHEGETVLEQNTANQLRHMINKYEDSEQQSVNFREAIQEQTRALVERLDSILNIMSTDSTNKLVSSEMKRIQSPTDENIINMIPVYSR